VTLHLGTILKEASKNENGLRLLLNQPDGTLIELHVDHVIAATGYQVKLQRLGFLDPDLRSQVKTVEDAPVLNTNFESSVPGLHFVGLAASSSFGPLCRFAYGAKFTSDRVARHLTSTTL
jgi:pyruvate/2-oxoglutarate dehydrogenase complex dihydrolipoamide dehydrogenase (E3) component